MTIHSEKMWAGLLGVLDSLESPIDPWHYFHVVAKWAKENQYELGDPIVRLYGLNWLMDLDPDQFPIQENKIDVEIEISNMHKLKPKKNDTVGMLIRDILWNAVTYKSSVSCPNCRYDDLRVLIDEDSKSKLIYACDSCGWAQNENGTKSETRGTGRPATLAVLRARGILRA